MANNDRASVSIVGHGVHFDMLATAKKHATDVATVHPTKLIDLEAPLLGGNDGTHVHISVVLGPGRRVGG